MKNIFTDSEWPAWKAQAKFFKIQTIVTTLNKKWLTIEIFTVFCCFSVYCEKGKRKVKYLTKKQVQLGFDKASEADTEETCAEDKNWGVEEIDNVRFASNMIELELMA